MSLSVSMFSQSGTYLVAGMLWLSVAQLPHLAVCTCYMPNGTQIPTEKDHIGKQWEACPNSPTCCVLNRSNPAGGDLAMGLTKDECLPNGLCENDSVKNSTHRRIYWRNLAVKVIGIMSVWMFAR